MEEEIKSLSKSVDNLKTVVVQLLEILKLHSDRIDMANERIDILKESINLTH